MTFSLTIASCSGAGGAHDATPTTSPATTGHSALPLGEGIPAPTAPAEQVRVSLPQSPTPMAVAGDTVWVGTPSGIAAFDASTMEKHGDVNLPLSTAVLAVSADGVWVLSGSDELWDGPLAENPLPLYHLARVDPATLRVAFETDLPVHSDGRINRKIRMAASPGAVWVAFRDEVIRVDAATDAVDPIDLDGHLVGNIAADGTGLWVATAGGITAKTAEGQVLRIDGSTREVRATPDINPDGFMWSIAATDDAAWLVQVYLEPNSHEATLHLVRIDPNTLATKAFRVPAIAVVTGDDQVWVQAYDRYHGPADTTGIVGQVDPETGKITRTVDIAIGGIPGSSDNGYNNPPFAVEGGRIWSTYDGLERTTL